MPRGRKKDLTISPTRALSQQRNYRARRAQYVSDLEERCRRVEAENVQLRNDLAAARAGQAAPAILTVNPQVIHASTELIHNLSLASASLERFHQLALSETFPSTSDLGRSFASSSRRSCQHSGNVRDVLRTALLPSPAPSPPCSSTTAGPLSPRSHNPPRRKRLHREDSPDSVTSHLEYPAFLSRNRRSPSLESECCGGIIDCRDLVEPESGHPTDRDSGSETSHLCATPPEVTPAPSKSMRCEY